MQPIGFRHHPNPHCFRTKVYKLNIVNQKSFYVAASRARDEITLITDDPKKLAERLQVQTGEKINALEAYVEAEKERLHEKADDSARTTKDEKHNKPPEIKEDLKDQAKVDEENTSLKSEIEDLQKLSQKQLGDYER